MNAGRRGMALLRETLDLWLSNNAFQHAGALAFYTLFSLAPLLIIVVTITGVVFGAEAVRGEISAQIDDLVGPQAAAAVEEAVRRSRVEQAGLWPTILGVSALLFGSTTVFAQMQTSLNQFWGVAARPSRSGLLVFVTTRFASLGLVLIIGFLLLVSFLVTMLIAAIVQFAGGWIPVPPLVVAALDALASLLVSTLLFATIFKVLPDVRLHWHDMWRGAFVTAALFVGGQSLISLYLTRAAPASTYGAAGALVVVLMWVYYSSLIVFMGAAMTRAMVRLRHEYLVPKATAVRVRLTVVEE